MHNKERLWNWWKSAMIMTGVSFGILIWKNNDLLSGVLATALFLGIAGMITVLAMIME